MNVRAVEIKATAILLGVLLSCCNPADAVAADLETVRVFDIAPQRLETALIEFSKQADLQVIGATDTVADARTNGVKGKLTSRAALNALLEHTAITFHPVGMHSVQIVSVPPTVSARDAGGVALTRSLAKQTQIAQSAPQDRLNTADQQPAAPKERDADEIIVTAQKRAERLQDVPVPVTAINASSLVDSNQLGLQDYYTKIPGLVVTPRIQSALSLSIRGVTTGGFSNPTVGVTVDDIPYGASTSIGGGLITPDIDPSNLARVEVLRGPQGTLYGASSMGGVFKFVTRDPSTEGFSGRVQGGVSGVRNGDGAGYNVRASANVPLGDTLAIRVAGFHRLDPGYIDNPVLGIDGLNRAQADGGHLSALWRPTDTFSLKLSALMQRMTGDGSPDVDAGLDDLQQDYVRNAGAYDRKAQAYGVVMNARLGTAELTSISGYSINKATDSFDFSYLLSSTAQGLFGVNGVPIFDDNTLNKFSQEIRLMTPLGPKFEWLLGAFYTHESSLFLQHPRAADRASGVVVGVLGDSRVPTKYTEYAIFTDLTWKLTDRFDVQAGVRRSRIEQDLAALATGTSAAACTTSPCFLTVDARAEPTTYLLTPSFRVAPDFLLYARVASGYRAGGINSICLRVSVQCQYEPDKTRNYEIGLKRDFLDRKLSIDASIYHIDWQNIQLSLVSPEALGYQANGSAAESRGVELAVDVKPITGMAISAWAVWNDAVLSEDLPPNSTAQGFPLAFSGDRLANTSRFSAYVSLTQNFPLTMGMIGFISGSVSYVGDRKGVFLSPSRQDLPAYAKTDLLLGAKSGSWTANLFVNNLSDRRGVLSGGLGQFPPFVFQYVQPRTVGVNISRDF